LVYNGSLRVVAKSGATAKVAPEKVSFVRFSSIKHVYGENHSSTMLDIVDSARENYQRARQIFFKKHL